MQYPYNKPVIYNSFHEMLKGLYENYANSTAVKYIEKGNIICYTYSDLINHICALHNFFQLQNIKCRNIGIVSENRYEYITVYLASVFFNVIVPMDKESDTETIEKTIEKFDIDVLFYTDKTKRKLTKPLESGNVITINIDEEYSSITGKLYSVREFFKETEKVDKEKFSVLASTSGTDGEVKGVMLSQYNILSNLRAALENNVLKSPTLSVLPMNHTYGFNPGVLNTLYIGGELCINTDLKYLKRDLRVFNPYFIGVVPMLAEGIYNNIIREAKRKNKYAQFCRMIKISNYLLKHKIDMRKLFFGNIINKNLRLMVSGGAPLDEKYIKKYRELGIILLNGYGMTECSPLIAVNREFSNVSGSVGTVIKDADVKIADDGEIMVKGPNVMLGYYNNKGATAESIEDGYFKTGDLGYVKDRVVFITGRKKNLIILENGKNFSPETIENKISELPYIKGCIVTARKVKNTSVIVAKIYMDAYNGSIEDDIKKINKSLPSYMNIDKYEITEKEFEKNSSNKIRRNLYDE